MSIADKLLYLNGTKTQLREAINDAFGAGLTETTPFREYANVEGLWNPRLLFLSGEQGAWYDPSDLSTLFQDAAGTTPVTASGDPVGLVLDKSGNGNNALQEVSAARPVYREAGGRRFLDFSGMSYLEMPKLLGISLSQVTTSIAYRPLENTSIDFTGVFWVSTSYSPESALYGITHANVASSSSKGLVLRRLSTDAAYILDATPVDTIDQVISVKSDWASSSVEYRKNGDTLHQGSTTLSTGVTPSAIPAQTTLGNRSDQSVGVDSHMYGCVHILRTLTSLELRALEKYMSIKAGVILP